MKNLIYMLFAFLILAVSCKRELPVEPKATNVDGSIQVSKMTDIKVPKDFNWSLSKTVQLDITLEDATFGVYNHKLQIFTSDPSSNNTPIVSGSISTILPFQVSLSVLSSISDLYVLRTAPDNSKVIEKVKIATNNSIKYTIKSGLKKTTSLGKAGSPDCNSGCTQTITTNNSNITANTGNVICVTGNNITIGFNANGGTIRICGSNVTVQNANLNNASSLIVTATASVSFASLNLNGTNTSFKNWGVVSMSNSFTPGGSVTNDGTINAGSDYNLNSQSNTTNNATINITQSMNVNGSSIVTNNGSITASNNFKVNGTASFINNCKLWVKKEFQNNSIFKNYSYVRVDMESKINGGSELGLYNGAMFSTKDITVNGTIKGYNSTSLVKVLNKTIINGGGLVTSALQFCDNNGIETNNGSINNGAVLACGIYIASGACNPEGNGTPSCTDADNDGVCDANDCYPNDPAKAYCNTVSTSTLAFEDQWPFTGDYDMNDVVISYNYTVISNATNNVVRVEAAFVLKATGGAYNNGFAVQFPVERTKVSGVTGAVLEAGQAKAVLVLFNDMRALMNGWNTFPNSGQSANVNFNIGFNISNGPSLNTFGLGAYNPFIWNGTAGFGRGYEIHLPGQLPTDLANQSLFGTKHDGSNLNTGDTYVSNNGRYPWAINIPAVFDYPVEKADINTAYTKFATWVSSNGTQFANWYTNQSGYRNQGNIY